MMNLTTSGNGLNSRRQRLLNNASNGPKSQVSSQREAFPFIVGCGRSGTTLLTVMLSSHPELAIPGETGGFILRFLERFTEYRNLMASVATLQQPIVEAMIEQLSESHRFRAWELDRSALISRICESGAGSAEDVIRSCFAQYAHQQGKKRFGDKTPNHVLSIDELARAFPESVFIHLIRDGRDVSLAILEASWGPEDIVEAAIYWKHRVEAGSNSGKELGSERYLEVHYEDLIANPESILRQVSSLIGIDYHPAMLCYSEAVSRQLEMSPVPVEDKSLLLPPTAGLRDWRTQMPPEDVQLFELEAGSLLAQLGYPVSEDQRSA